jgi:phosphate acyltransferase
MGGDNAPEVPVSAALDAATKFNVQVTLIGDESLIKPLVDRRSTPARSIEIVDAPEHVSMEDEAVAAVRRKRRASIPVALDLLKSGVVDGFVSAGNTGAVVASSVFGLGRLPGVSRPGIAIPLPTVSGVPMLLIDAGAIVDPKPDYLWQHARLASTFVRVSTGKNRPTIGLISNGEEAGKGNALTRGAHELLAGDRELNFVGNVESRAMATRPCDVLVTDGFTGNILLKTAEGVVALMQETLRNEFRSRWYTGLLATMLKPAFRRAGKNLDYREIGGAPLLGVNGLVTIAHGSSDVTAIVNAIRGASENAGNNMLEALRQSITSGQS